jgi:hypothetical protein
VYEQDFLPLDSGPAVSRGSFFDSRVVTLFES